jgi:hypothetical protein
MTLNASLLDMRFRPVRLIRSLFMVVLILFVFLNLHVLMNFEPRNTEIYDRTLLYKLRHSNILNAQQIKKRDVYKKQYTRYKLYLIFSEVVNYTSKANKPLLHLFLNFILAYKKYYTINYSF